MRCAMKRCGGKSNPSLRRTLPGIKRNFLAFSCAFCVLFCASCGTVRDSLSKSPLRRPLRCDVGVEHDDHADHDRQKDAVLQSESE